MDLLINNFLGEERHEFSEVTKIVIPTIRGEYTILPKHQTITLLIGEGNLQLTVKDKTINIKIIGGVFYFFEDRGKIIVEELLDKKKINKKVCQQNLEKLKMDFSGRDGFQEKWQMDKKWEEIRREELRLACLESREK